MTIKQLEKLFSFIKKHKIEILIIVFCIVFFQEKTFSVFNFIKYQLVEFQNVV